MKRFIVFFLVICVWLGLVAQNVFVPMIERQKIIRVIDDEDFTLTGVWDFSGATVSGISVSSADSVAKIQTGANPTTDVDNNIAIDNNDKMIEFYDESDSYVISAFREKTFTFLEPDSVRAILGSGGVSSDTLSFCHFPAEVYPHGVTITDIIISSSEQCSDTHELLEWSDEVGTSISLIESITLSSSTRNEDDGTLSDASLAADSYVAINSDDTTDDIMWLMITLIFYVNEGN